MLGVERQPIDKWEDSGRPLNLHAVEQDVNEDLFIFVDYAYGGIYVVSKGIVRYSIVTGPVIAIDGVGIVIDKEYYGAEKYFYKV